jgi:hypothetical protein
MDENTGTSVADSVSGHTGTFAGTPNPNWVPNGHPGHGSGLTFPSNNAHVTVASHADFSPAALSIVAWVYFADATPVNAAVLVSKVNTSTAVYQWGFSVRTNGTVRCLVQASAVVYTHTTVATLADATWTHVACTWNASTIRVYLNATEDGTGTAAAGTQADNGYPVNIGNNNYAGGLSPFVGTLDELTFHNHALTQGEIQTLMGGSPPLPPARRWIQLSHWLHRWFGLPVVLARRALP